MFSGSERQSVAQCRHRRVTWAWIKARGFLNRQPAPAHSILTTSVLPVNDSVPAIEAASWRESVAAMTHRTLARQICGRFFDLSIFHNWYSETPKAIATSRMLSPALPSYCKDAASDEAEPASAERLEKARILKPVLRDDAKRRGAVLIPLRSKAA